MIEHIFLEMYYKISIHVRNWWSTCMNVMSDDESSSEWRNSVQGVGSYKDLEMVFKAYIIWDEWVYSDTDWHAMPEL